MPAKTGLINGQVQELTQAPGGTSSALCSLHTHLPPLSLATIHTQGASMAGTTRLEAGGSDGEYTQDGTTDLHGNPILRSKRGGWRACAFVVVYEVFERMAYYGISSNLVLYLTTELHQGTVLSANNVTNWVGTIWMTPVIGAYIADAHLGRYRTFMVASIIYLL
uniref:Uncharacterized protein n=1 Tax=Aegilops tauschii subsp. strangulata TaxID=200361 RepID=A0A452YDH7_AEGTS